MPSRKPEDRRQRGSHPPSTGLREEPREALRKSVGFCRGDLVTVASSGDYGKPRPALIVQADAYAGHPSLTVLPLTSELHDMPLLRVTVEPGESTGLRLRSQVMVDKATTIPRAKAGGRIGPLAASVRIFTVRA